MLRCVVRLKKNSRISADKVTDNKDNFSDKSLSVSLEDNMKLFRDIFRNDDTVVTRCLDIPYSGDISCCLVYIDGMVDTKI